MKNFITIGTFDGVHKGHVMLIKRLQTLAKKHNMRPAVLYFPLPPKALISGETDMSVLTLPSEKPALLKEQGINALYELDFKECRKIEADAFFKKLLAEYNMGGLLAGKDFACGHNRSADIPFLRRGCEENGIALEVEDFFNMEGHKISSSRIRAALSSGHIEEANDMLGRPYSVDGTVIKGQQLGRKLGFPTANLDTGREKILPRGVFAGYVYLGKEKFKSVINIGFRPTVNTIYDNIPLVEAHILDFDRNIYGRKITVDFKTKIRGEKKFDGLDALIFQITEDKKYADKVL